MFSLFHAINTFIEKISITIDFEESGNGNNRCLGRLGDYRGAHHVRSALLQVLI